MMSQYPFVPVQAVGFFTALIADLSSALRSRPQPRLLLGEKPELFSADDFLEGGGIMNDRRTNYNGLQTTGRMITLKIVSR